MNFSSAVIFVIVRPLALLLFRVLFRFRVYGRDNLPKKGPFIIASNHVSFLDPVALGIAVPFELNFIALENLFRIKYFSRLISFLNAFPIKRDAPDFGAIREAVRRLKSGKVVALFPEGTRSKDGSLNEGLPGVGFLASKTNVPVIPTFILGSEKALPRNARFIRLKPVSLYFGKPVTLDKVKEIEDRKECYRKIAKIVMCEIARLRQDADK